LFWISLPRFLYGSGFFCFFFQRKIAPWGQKTPPLEKYMRSDLCSGLILDTRVCYITFHPCLTCAVFCMFRLDVLCVCTFFISWISIVTLFSSQTKQDFFLFISFKWTEEGAGGEFCEFFYLFVYDIGQMFKTCYCEI